ncbi:MAG: acetyl-CoA carboxylase, carboxyltransferase subunit beta [Cyanobacteria bacterium J06642_2]
MPLSDWFADLAGRRQTAPAQKPQQDRDISDGLWQKCPSCDALTYTKDLQANYEVCPSCSYHHRVPAPTRIAHLIEPRTWMALDEQLYPQDPLNFVDKKAYPERVRSYQDKTHLKDAVITGLGHLRATEAHRGQTLSIALGVMDFRFMGGSMGSVVGEKITRLIERATAERLPLVVCSASGGARMQEGVFSLMQMAKTSAALDRHRTAGQLFISILTHPTMGGVTASFAMLGDIVMAEPAALIGFAGRRVIEQTIGQQQRLPNDFQTAEYLLGRGLIDAIVPRTELRQRIAQLIAMHCPPAEHQPHLPTSPGTLTNISR